MRKIAAAVLTIICIISNIAGACISVPAAEPVDAAISESFIEEELPAESAIDPFEDDMSGDFEAEETEAAEEPGPANIIEEEDAPADFDLPNDESSLSDALVPEEIPSSGEQTEIPPDTESVAATEEVQEELVGAADSTGTDAEIEIFSGLSHGFGLGIGTAAEGWLDNAVAFWERNMS